MPGSDVIQQEEHFFRDLIPATGPDSEVALNIIRAGDFLFDHLSRIFRAHGMSEAQFNVLVTLEDVPEGLTMVEIARRMLISRAGISGLIRGLEGKGWVVCAACPGDARAVRVRLTEAGRRAFDEVLPDQQRAVREAVGGCFSTEEKILIVRLLTRLRGRLAQARAGR